MCHDHKLAANSTAEYIGSCEGFFRNTIFKEDEPWPNVVVAPSHMIDTDEASNPQINVSRRESPNVGIRFRADEPEGS